MAEPKNGVKAPRASSNAEQNTDFSELPATELPATELPATELPATELTSEEKLAKANAIIEAQELENRKKDAATKIASLNEAILKAETRKKKYEGDDEDTVAFREFTQMKTPEAFASIMSLPGELREELKNFKLSLLSPEEKDLRIQWDVLNNQVKLATQNLEALRATITDKYPEFFGAAPKVKAEKKDKTEKADAGNSTPFTGVLNSKEVDEAKIKECIANGITTESAIIEAIYGKGFTISGSRPRFQIHSLRDKMGLIEKRA